jgi:hypothetical protein
MSDVVEDEEEDGSGPLAAAAFLSRSTAAACSSSRSRRASCTRRRAAVALAFSGVGVLDKSVEPLPKGLSLRVRRHGGEEVAAPTRGAARVWVLQPIAATRRWQWP